MDPRVPAAPYRPRRVRPRLRGSIAGQARQHARPARARRRPAGPTRPGSSSQLATQPSSSASSRGRRRAGMAGSASDQLGLETTSEHAGRLGARAVARQGQLVEQPGPLRAGRRAARRAARPPISITTRPDAAEGVELALAAQGLGQRRRPARARRPPPRTARRRPGLASAARAARAAARGRCADADHRLLDHGPVLGAADRARARARRHAQLGRRARTRAGACARGGRAAAQGHGRLDGLGHPTGLAGRGQRTEVERAVVAQRCAPPTGGGRARPA